MKLIEIFNSKIEPASSSATQRVVKTSATINDRKITVFLTCFGTDNIWTLSFAEGKDHDLIHKTGSGGEFQVFSFIKDTLLNFIKSHKPSGIRFTASKADENRGKLYARMLKRAAVILSNYKIVDPVSDHDDIKFFLYKMHESLAEAEHDRIIKRAQAGIKVWRGVKRPGEAPSDPGDLGKGTYYSTMRARAKSYGHTLTREIITLENPLVLTAKKAYELADKYKTVRGTQDERHAGATQMTKDLKARGYDGLIAISNYRDVTELEVVDYRNVK